MSSIFQRIDTVFLKVKNLDRSVTWYTEVLGFSLRWRSETHAALNIGETPLTLVQAPENHTSLMEQAYFNFYVEDIQLAYSHLKNHQVEVGEVGSDEQVSWFSFKDIDGNQLDVCSF